jgi:hypothetical protein
MAPTWFASRFASMYFLRLRFENWRHTNLSGRG